MSGLKFLFLFLISLAAISSALANNTNSIYELKIKVEIAGVNVNYSNLEIDFPEYYGQFYPIPPKMPLNDRGETVFKINYTAPEAGVFSGMVVNEVYYDQENPVYNGFPFQLVMLNHNMSLKIKYMGGLYDLVNQELMIKMQGTEFSFCSYVISGGDDARLFRHNDTFPKSSECNLNLFIEDLSFPPGTYFLTAIGGNNKQQLVQIYPFQIKEVEVTNPYNSPAEGFFEITGAECFFLNGEKTIKLNYNSNESSKITIFCPNQSSINSLQLKKDFTKENNVFSYLINTFSAGVMAIFLSALFERLYNPESKKVKKLLTKGMIVISLVLWIICFFVLWYFKWF